MEIWREEGGGVKKPSLIRVKAFNHQRSSLYQRPEAFPKSKLRHNLQLKTDSVKDLITDISSKAFMFIGMTSRFTKGRLHHRLCHYYLQWRSEALLKTDSGTELVTAIFCSAFMFIRKQTLSQNLPLLIIIKDWSFKKNRFSRSFKGAV